MQQLLIFSISVALVYAKTTIGDSDEGESSSSLEVNHGGKYDQGYSFGDTKFDQGSFGEDQSGINENQGGDGGYQQEDINSQDGGDDSFGGGYEGQYNNEGFERSKGYQADDGESEGSYENNRKGY